MEKQQQAARQQQQLDEAVPGHLQHSKQLQEATDQHWLCCEYLSLC
jgi:hypothetical protein